MSSDEPPSIALNVRGRLSSLLLTSLPNSRSAALPCVREKQQQDLHLEWREREELGRVLCGDFEWFGAGRAVLEGCKAGSEPLHQSGMRLRARRRSRLLALGRFVEIEFLVDSSRSRSVVAR